MINTPNNMKFNKGDRVVKFVPACFDNLFHLEKYIKYDTVSDANEEYFTTNGKLTSFDNGTNYSECSQITGLLVRCPQFLDETRWFNVKTEMDEIEKYHELIKENFKSKIKKQNEEEIEKLKDNIKSIEKRIKRLETMEDAFLGYTTIKLENHIQEMNEIFQKKLKQCTK